jgi:alanine racemase
MKNCRGTFADISLDALEHNVGVVREHAPGSAILVAVKANAYGHGAAAISRHLETHRLANYLGVAAIEEALELRDAGITLPILVLGLTASTDSCLRDACRHNITLTVASYDSAAAFNRVAETAGTRARVHLKVDTGMGRIGCQENAATDIAARIAGLPHIELEGIFSHMPVSDQPDNPFNADQIARFSRIALNTEHAIGRTLIKHLANSGGILNFPQAHLDMVRPGIMCYGYPPARRPDNAQLTPVMTLKSGIIAIKHVPAGTPISYGHTYHSSAAENIATIPIGYGDGYPRLLSGQGEVLIADKRYPVAGRVCMDQLMLSLGNDAHAPETEVILFGAGSLDAWEVADRIGTIPYEITCGIAPRVPRIYRSSRQL